MKSYMPRFMLYSHNTRGFGHAVRSINLAWGLYQAVPEASILYCSGGAQSVFPLLPPNTDYVKLPSLQAKEIGDDLCVFPARLQIPMSQMFSIRRDILTAVTNSFRPHVLIVDYAPLGKKKELEPAIQLMRTMPNRLVAYGMRDILNDVERARDYLDEEVFPAVRTYFDVVFVYGDATVFDTTRTYNLPADILHRCVEVGYVTSTHRPSVDREIIRSRVGCNKQDKLLVVNFGGGRDTTTYVNTVLSAYQIIAEQESIRLVLARGPYANPDEDSLVSAAQLENVLILDFVPWLVELISAADVFVGTSSYNLCAELLATGTPAILFARSQVDSAEQSIRAEALTSRFDHIMALDEMDSVAMAKMIRTMLKQGRRESSAPAISIQGAVQVANYVKLWLTNNRAAGDK